MISTNQIDTIARGNVYGPDNDKIGSVGQVYLDNKTGQPEWVTIKTGLFGTKESFVPLAEATVSGEDVHVPYGKAKVKDAPNLEADGELSPQEEDELYRYYGVSGGGQDSGSDHRDTTVTTGTTGGGEGKHSGRDEVRDEVTDTEGHDTSGPNTDDAMTRSEEQLKVGTRREETGRARLRKYVVTEQQSVTVPVSREEVRVQREPITDANRGAAESGADITEEEHEITLHAERPVVNKETVAVERVKVGTETVRDEETVTGEVRKEQIELDDDTDGGRDTKDKRRQR